MLSNAALKADIYQRERWTFVVGAADVEVQS